MQKNQSEEKIRTTSETSDAYWSIFLSVQRTLGLLGESGKQATLSYLLEAGVPEEEIPFRLDQFVRVLREVFGMGSVIIEAEIVKNIMLMESPNENNRILAEAFHELEEGGD